MNAPQELQLVQMLGRELAAHGNASVAYLTAEFQPFSNAQRPDLIFVPASGGRKGQTAVVELKMEAMPRSTGRSFLNLLEHKEFCEEALERTIYCYAFVTNQPVPELSVAQLARGGVHIVRVEEDLTALAASLLQLFEVGSSS
ncbi:hypothetical protein [Phenylobacterium sp.]|uniref:hypothetical protein n=1 Tax=Phenylobacterium sp. TaxID=1871053 RepID=UPI002FCA5475